MTSDGTCATGRERESISPLHWISRAGQEVPSRVTPLPRNTHTYPSPPHRGSGHAGSRFGWALIKKKHAALFGRAAEYTIDRTLGISVDVQARADGVADTSALLLAIC